MNKKISWLLGIGLLDILLCFVWLAVWKYFDKDAIFLNILVVCVGLVTYFGFLMFGHAMGGDWAVNMGGMRTAITASVVTVYLVLVGLVAFLTEGPDKLLPITETLLSSFTSIVGIVLAFYFGSSAYMQVQEKKIRLEMNQNSSQKESEEKV